MPTDTDARTESEKPKTWFEWATTTANGVTATLGAAGAVVAAIAAIYNWILPSSKTSSICQFSDGWIDYRPLPGLELGSACSDMAGSGGQIVAKGTGRAIPVSTICQFSDGWHDYSAFSPTRIGTSCHDENGKFGRVVKTGMGPEL